MRGTNTPSSAEAATATGAGVTDLEPTLPTEPVAAQAQLGDAPAQVFSDTEKRVTLAALMIVFLLSALDQTIVSTAMPKIVAQLQGLDLYSWVTTSYLLSSTVMVPIWGKLSDIYGRKPILVAGITVFILGSVLCGLAGEFGPLPLIGGGMMQLIVFRAVQGIGGGALFTGAFSVIADLFPPRERGKFGGLFGAVFGLSSVLGPIIGGFFTDLHPLQLGSLAVAGWRWCFYVNLPLAGLALFMIIAKTPPLLHRRPGAIDVVGAALLIATVIPLLLALTLGGRDKGWDSPEVLGLFAAAAVGLALFVWAELRAANPLLSMDLFRIRTFTTANLAAFVTSMAFMGMVVFLPLYMQLGQGRSATVSGWTMFPLMGGLIGSATLSGLYASKVGRYKAPLIVGGVVILLAAFLLTRVDRTTATWDVGWRLALLGFGLGPQQSLFNLAVQNAVPPAQIGVVTSSNQFFRQIGSTIGVAIFGAVLTQSLADEGGRYMRAHLPPAVAAHMPQRRISLGDLEKAAVAAQVRGAAAPAPAAAGAAATAGMGEVVTAAIRDVIYAALGVSALGFLLMLLVPDTPLRDRGPQAAAARKEASAAVAH